MDSADEKKFLHELASPIGTALFAIDAVIETVEGGKNTDLIMLEQLIQINEALVRVRDLLTERRGILQRKEGAGA